MKKSDKYEIYQIYPVTYEKYEINLCDQNRDGIANKRLKSQLNILVNGKNYLITLPSSLEIAAN